MGFSWQLPTLFSAAALGIYDLCKKASVKDNSVMPALFLSTLSGSLFFVAVTAATGQFFHAAVCPWQHFWLIVLKSFIVAASWVCVFYAMRELPVTLASPIRATSPLWTALGGILIYGEFPTPLKAAGMGIIFAGYILFTFIGKSEGFSWKSKGIILIIAGTLLGAASALYDKFLLNRIKVDRQSLQFYFSVDLVFILGTAYLIRRFFGHRHQFQWRWSIPATGILLIIADYAYFYALSCTDAPISQVSLIRRCSCIVTFALGAKIFHDTRLKQKTAALALLLTGIYLICR